MHGLKKLANRSWFVVAAIALVATACVASPELDRDAAAPNVDTEAVTEAESESPDSGSGGTETESADPAEDNAAPDDLEPQQAEEAEEAGESEQSEESEESAESDAGSGADSAPTAPVLEGTPAEFRAESLLAVSNDGRYAYAATASYWDTSVPCDAEPGEAIAVAAVEPAAQGAVVGVGAGLQIAGVARSWHQNDDGQVAIFWSCGPVDEPATFVQQATLGADGKLIDAGPAVALAAEGSDGSPFLLGLDGGIVLLELLVRPDVDDFETWFLQEREVDLTTGDFTVVAERSLDEDSSIPRQLLEINGLSFRAIDDPSGALGCEGAGAAATIEVDDGSGPRLALGENGLVSSSIEDLHVNNRGHIAWTSGCEGFVSPFVGKVQPDGSILDAHYVELNSGDTAFVDYRLFRLTDDGFLVAVGKAFGEPEEPQDAVFARFDLMKDPFFVNTATPPPDIDAEPLFEALDGTSTWHVGKTLNEQRKCGGDTLYGNTDAGFVRAFPADFEVATIVEANVGEIQTYESDFGPAYQVRTVVVQTECPDRWDGRRVWFGFESGSVSRGLFFERADLPEVADVLSVRDVVDEDTGFVTATMVEIERLDGSVIEAELVPIGSR